jgi:molecular chaperone DnaK
MHVTAKDLGTGKEQAIRITASSGLSEEEIKKIVKDAEAHAQEDKEKREKVDARNQLDGLIYSTEKTMKEYGEKIDEALKTELTSAIEESKAVLAKDDLADMKAQVEKLNAVAGKVASEIYKNASQAQPGDPNAGQQGGTGSGPQDGGNTSESGNGKDDVIDADYKEV